MALYESQRKRVAALCRMLSTATRNRVTQAKVLREVISIGFTSREKARRHAEENAEHHRGMLAAAGFPDLANLIVVTGVVTVPYAPPGRKAQSNTKPFKWTGPIVLRPRKDAVASPDGLDHAAEVPTNEPPPRAGNGRALRRKRTATRRAGAGDDAGGGGSGDGDDPPASDPRAHGSPRDPSSDREVGRRRECLAHTERRIHALVMFVADGGASECVLAALRDLEARARVERAVLAEAEDAGPRRGAALSVFRQGSDGDLGAPSQGVRELRDGHEREVCAARDYPPLMPTRMASVYCGFCTTGALRKAKKEGRVRAEGAAGARALSSGRERTSTDSCAASPLVIASRLDARRHLHHLEVQSMKKVEWVVRWSMTIASRPTLPGVWARKDGGFVVRARVKDPAGHTHEILKALTDPKLSAADALSWLEEEKRRQWLGKQDGIQSLTTRFDAYAAQLFERKVAKRAIRSAASRRKWLEVLEKHLFPAFGPVELPTLRRAQIIAWLDQVGLRIAAGKLSPRTANTWLSILKTIVTAYVSEHELEKNPIDEIESFPTIDHPTYTDEEPNSLPPACVPEFLKKFRELFPQHYAMVVLGFSLGLRPSTMRPLRRCGSRADVDWETGELRVRRSQTYGDEVMDSTKQGTRERKALPPELLELLRWHVDTQVLASPMQDSEYLFPSATGGFRSRSVLDKPFALTAKAIGLRYGLSSKAMRRTYQDLAREAGVPDVATRSISGHQTEEMQRHYSTVQREEQRESIARVIDLAGVRVKRTGTDGW